MHSRIGRFWTRILHLGDVSGKLLTLIALPSAIVAIIAFYDEIGDVLTSPDVRADIHSVGLRCCVAIDQVPAGVDRNAFGIEKCNTSPISAWVKLDLENQDAIDRTLASVAFQISFPKKLAISDAALFWTEARVVNHVIQNDEQTSQRWPWRAMLLAADQLVPIEIDFRAFEQENQRSFSIFRDLILENPSPLSDVEIPIEILGRFSGSDGWVSLGSCNIQIPKESVERKRLSPVIRSLTRRCN